MFHLVSAENMNTRTLLSTVANEIGLTLLFEQAQSLLERKLEKLIEPNRLYSTQTWNFQNPETPSTSQGIILKRLIR